MTRARTLLTICALALPLAVLAAGCGGGEAADDDPRDVIDRTFSDVEVTSGTLDLSASVTATGEEGGSFSAELSGPFEGEADGRELPQLDVTGSVSGEGGGESIDESGRLVLTTDNAFIEYEDEVYEAGAELFSQLEEEFEAQAGLVDEGGSFREGCEEAIEQLNGDPSACDVDVLEDWLTDLENHGTETIEGVEAVHVGGALNVERVFEDIGELAQTIPGVSLDGFQPSQFASAVPEATFDLYSGVDDDTLRRLEVRLVVDPSAATAGIAVLPIDTIELDFSLSLGAVNEPQTIAPPEGPTTPLEDLLGDVDRLDLGGLGGGLGGQGLPEAEDPGAGTEGSQPGGEEISPDQAQEYLECIQEASESGDPEAINACAEQL